KAKRFLYFNSNKLNDLRCGFWAEPEMTMDSRIGNAEQYRNQNFWPMYLGGFFPANRGRGMGEPGPLISRV
ncbi:MAG TPA: hypothetical protein VII81_13285, partial [Terriglobales bacterium]